MSEDLKKQIEEQVNAAVAGLKAKNEELLSKVKKYKDVAEKYGDIDVEALAADAKAYKELQQKAEEEKGEYKTLYKKQMEQAAALEADNERIKRELDKTKTQFKVTEELSKVKIPDPLRPVVVDMLAKEAELEDSALLIGGKPAGEYIKEWSESEIGKHFIVVDRSGGGAMGGGGKGIPSEAKYFDKKSGEYNLTKQAQVAKTDPELFNKLRKQYKNQDLASE